MSILQGPITSIINKLSDKAFVNFAKEFLESLRFKNIQVTKQQKDFGADLVGEYDGNKWVIQVKHWNKKVGIKAVQEVYTSTTYYHVKSCMVVSNNEYTPAAIRLASECKCRLINRDDIAKWMNKEFKSPQEFLSYIEQKEIKRFRIPTSELVDEYYKVKKKLEKQPTGEEIDIHSRFSYAVYQKRWGAWDNFLQSIGESLDYRRNRPVTKDELITSFHNLREKLGRVPNGDELKKYGHSVSSYLRKFGSWNKFLNLIGEPVTKRMNIPKQEMIQEFYRVKKELGHTPTQEEMGKYGKIHPSTYTSMWGTWGKMLKELGESYREINIPEEDLIKDYLKTRKLLKKNSLSKSDIDEYGKYSSPTYQRRWGSWGKFKTFINEA